MERHVSLLGDPVQDRAFELSAQRQHAAEDFAQGGEVVIGDPLAQGHELLVEHGRGVEYANHVFGENRGFAIVQADDDAGHASLAEGHEHAPADGGLHAGGHAVGEHRVEGHGQGDVAELQSGAQGVGLRA